MKNIVICTIKSWNLKDAYILKERLKNKYHITVITDKAILYDIAEKVKPDYIFFPHWSYIIPKKVYSNYNCVVFHITDLPYGRGGSPLQNLIVREIEDTKISAIKVEEELDAGAVYIKENLNLNGTAEEIFIRASKIIFEKMIPYILENSPEASRQSGEITMFKRRNEKDGELNPEMKMKQIYDYIRMLDGEGYPNAYIKFGEYIFRFSRASLKSDRILADVEIFEEICDE